MSLPAKLPATTAALVRLLDKTFPHRCPKLREDAEAVQRYAGKRELVDALMDALANPDKENENMNWIEDV